MVSRRARPRFARWRPLHVTLRVRRGVWNLRTRRCFAPLLRAFVDGGGRADFTLIHYGRVGDDPFASVMRLAAPRTWLARQMDARAQPRRTRSGAR